MKFEFATANRIIFGPGSIDQVAPIAAENANRAFVITGRSPERSKPLLENLDKEGIEYTTFTIAGEPTTTIVQEGVEQARDEKSDIIISIGGGSVIDTGKAVAGMMTNSGDLLDYLEVVGKGQPLIHSPAKHIAIATTAGTGAEVTRNSVLSVPEHRVKVSMRSPLLLPWLAVVDPELTYTMPPDVTAGTGLDAMTQLMEAYVSNKANPLTDAICREGLKRAARSLETAYLDGSNSKAREDMSIASLFGGLALANAKLGAVHGFAAPLGAMFHAPHGVICGRLLPLVMRANVRALKKLSADSTAAIRYNEVAAILTNNPNAQADDGLDFVQELCRVLKVPPLSKFGLKQEDFPLIIAKAQNSSSMKGNPVILTEAELTNILEEAL